MKIGIVFAGQGAQYSGMGKDLLRDLSRRQRQYSIMAGDQVKDWCFDGDAETLKTDARDPADDLHCTTHGSL